MLMIQTDTITKTEGQKAVVANYAGGEKVGSNWTDKVMTVKGAANTRSLPQDQMEGVDEDEWVCNYYHFNWLM